LNTDVARNFNILAISLNVLKHNYYDDYYFDDLNKFIFKFIQLNF